VTNKVPEGKTVKNRLHLDVSPTDRTRDKEVDRVIQLGATLVDDRRNPDGSGWAVMTDPEGNEYCVVRSQEEYDRAE
jgi:predicted enzyme related to lactoylglutathione lyase